MSKEPQISRIVLTFFKEDENKESAQREKKDILSLEDQAKENEDQNNYSKKENELIPYGYIFRGIFMDWINESEPSLAEKLHTIENKSREEEEKEEEKKLYIPPFRPYAIQGCKIRLLPRLGYSDSLPIEHILEEQIYLKKLNSELWQLSKYERKKQHLAPTVGVKFAISTYDEEIKKVLGYILLNKITSSLPFGKHTLKIQGAQVQQISLSDIESYVKPIKKIRVTFFTPVAFSGQHRKHPIRFPLPHVFLANLLRQWNKWVGPEHSFNGEFLEWVEKNIFISAFNFETRQQTMGKKKPFFGGKGWVSYIIEADPENEKDMQNSKNVFKLILFGAIMNTGLGRTAGFGHYGITNAEFYN